MNQVNNHRSGLNTVSPLSCSATCQDLLNVIQRTKNALATEFRNRVSDAHGRMLQLELNEAEALARDTGFPLLTFPSLAREKAERLVAWESRQQVLRRLGQQSFAA